MNIENPFESGHIRNYILFYVGIVIIMILFFVASSLFLDVEKPEKKTFNTKPVVKQVDAVVKTQTKAKSSPFKLLDKAY